MIKRIQCIHCRKEMRNIHEYVDLTGQGFTVWYCHACDWTLVLGNGVFSVAWETYCLTHKEIKERMQI